MKQLGDLAVPKAFERTQDPPDKIGMRYQLSYQFA